MHVCQFWHYSIKTYFQLNFSIFSNFSIARNYQKFFNLLWTPRWVFYEVWKIERICNTIGIIIQDSKWTKDELYCDLWTCLIKQNYSKNISTSHTCVKFQPFCYSRFFSKMDIKLMNTHEIVNGNEPRIIFMTILLLRPTL